MCQFGLPDELGASPYGWHSKAPSSLIINLLSLAVRKSTDVIATTDEGIMNGASSQQMAFHH